MCSKPRVMHRKMTPYRDFFLSKKARSATLDLHAKAPGFWRRVVTRRGGIGFRASVRTAFRFRRQWSMRRWPRGPAVSFGSLVVRRDRRGPLRWSGVVFGGSPPISILLRRSGRRRSGDRALGLPASVATPPCAGAAARLGEESFRRLRTAGCFGGLRDPSRFFGTSAESSRPRGNLGVAEKVLRNRTGYCEGTREIFGFPRSVRGFSSRAFGSRRVDRSERLRSFAAKPAFPPWSERRWKPGVRPAEPTGRVAALGRFAFRVYLLGAAVRATAGIWPRKVRYRSSAGRKKPRRLRVREPSSAPRGVGVRVLLQRHRRESDLSDPAPHFLHKPNRCVNQILRWTLE